MSGKEQLVRGGCADTKQPAGTKAVSGQSDATVFRPMQEADTEAAAVLEAQCLAEAWSQKSYVDAIHNENAFYMVAERDGKIIGCCGYWRSFEDADICNVAVEQNCRKQGVAERMLTVLMRHGTAAGIENFTLEVRAGNIPAIRLYEKLGFTTEGVRRGFYENPKEDALIMWVTVHSDICEGETEPVWKR